MSDKPRSKRTVAEWEAEIDTRDVALGLGYFVPLEEFSELWKALKVVHDYALEIATRAPRPIPQIDPLPCTCETPDMSDIVSCGCGFSWCDKCHPAPSARCWNEENHKED